jgi:prepilin-type N-terminal cleavage/methylation domain-containing protein
MNTLPNPILRRAFTLVELLVVIAILTLLTILGVVAISAAFSRSDESFSKTQLNSIRQAIQAFSNDFRYEPPLAAPGGGGGVLTPENDPAAFAAAYGGSATTVAKAYEAARYRSEWSLPIYLAGVGDLNADGKLVYAEPGQNPPAANQDDGFDGPGMRNPGELRAWKVRQSNGTLRHDPASTGREYGPYLEPGALKSLVKEVRVNRTTGAPDPAGTVVMYRFQDRHGHPIRYYRGWPVRPLGGGPLTVAGIPVEIRNVKSVVKQLDLGTSNTDGTIVGDLDRDVLGASYALSVIRDDAQNIPAPVGPDFNPSAISDVDKAELRRILPKVQRVLP